MEDETKAKGNERLNEPFIELSAAILLQSTAQEEVA